MISTANLFWENNEWIISGENLMPNKADLILVFGDRIQMQNDTNYFNKLSALFPNAQRVLISTSGEVFNKSVREDSIVATALSFEHTQLKVCAKQVTDSSHSELTGIHLVNELLADNLRGLLVFSDGQVVNGSELVKGLYAPLVQAGKTIPISGGLAGDGARFQETLVGYNALPQSNQVVAVGLYGDRIKIGTGSMGGWDPFGVKRSVTKANKNVLYELDGKNALEIYKEYLGDLAAELPSSALLFPLQLEVKEQGNTIVRTVLSVDEEEGSMTFAGNIPEGSRVQLMKANFDRLIDGAGQSAQHALSSVVAQSQYALIISCVGRKLVLGQRIEEEVEEAAHVLGDNCTISGFYSYGEISPLHDVNESCELHNQTMTITAFSEE